MADCGNKCVRPWPQSLGTRNQVWKSSPDEKVGVMAKKGGLPSVVEYSPGPWVPLHARVGANYGGTHTRIEDHLGMRWHMPNMIQHAYIMPFGHGR